jgi:aminomethyltransferase
MRRGSGLCGGRHEPDSSKSRRAAQSHIDQPRLETPFHPRLAALSQQNDWYSWAGYKAPHSLWDEELEYFAIRSQAACSTFRRW